jgi:hypothetical protein
MGSGCYSGNDPLSSSIIGPGIVPPRWWIQMSLGALFLMGLIMIAWLVFVVFGISEEG